MAIFENPQTGERKEFTNPRSAAYYGYTLQIVEQEEIDTASTEEQVTATQELTNAENAVLDIINQFLAGIEGSNIYQSTTTTTSSFEEETQSYTPTTQDAAALFPYYPSNLIDLIVTEWTRTGSIDLALAQVRTTDEFQTSFPGIKREDGSLRMTEIQYLELKDNMKDQLRTYNLNPDVFNNAIVEAISGDVNAQEFAERLSFGYEQLLNNKDEVLKQFNEVYGYNLGETELFAMFIDPNISEAVLQNQILTSQILAEAEIAGVEIGLGAGTKFVEGKISQKQSQEIFGKAEELSGLTGAAAGRETTLTEEDIALGLAGLSPEQLNLVKRVGAQEASESAIIAGAATTQTGEVTGLVQQ
jgi:hypothetical protein